MMDITQLAQVLACTLDPNLRIEAERQLNEVLVYCVSIGETRVSTERVRIKCLCTFNT